MSRNPLEVSNNTFMVELEIPYENKEQRDILQKDINTREKREIFNFLKTSDKLEKQIQSLNGIQYKGLGNLRKKCKTNTTKLSTGVAGMVFYHLNLLEYECFIGCINPMLKFIDVRPTTDYIRVVFSNKFFETHKWFFKGNTEEVEGKTFYIKMYDNNGIPHAVTVVAGNGALLSTYNTISDYGILSNFVVTEIQNLKTGALVDSFQFDHGLDLSWIANKMYVGREHYENFWGLPLGLNEAGWTVRKSKPYLNSGELSSNEWNEKIIQTYCMTDKQLWKDWSREFLNENPLANKEFKFKEPYELKINWEDFRKMFPNRHNFITCRTEKQAIELFALLESIKDNYNFYGYLEYEGWSNFYKDNITFSDCITPYLTNWRFIGEEICYQIYINEEDKKLYVYMDKLPNCRLADGVPIIEFQENYGISEKIYTRD